MKQDASNRTPWQRVFSKFDMSQSEFARTIGRHRSKVSRALKDDKGRISGNDQELLIRAAKNNSINLTADDLTNVEI